MKITSKLVAVVLTISTLLLSMGVVSSADTYNNFEYTINNDSTVTITGYNGNATNVIIPIRINNKLVTAIGVMAFKDNHSMVSIAIPFSVTLIDDYAFYNCSALANISVTRVEEIGAFAFAYCTSLSKIVIPETVETIGYLAYEECFPMEGVNFVSPDTIIFDGVFDGCDNLTIYGYEDSTAYAYAQVNDITFEDLAPENTFTDVPVTQWYYPYVKFVCAYNLLQGINSTTFSPNGTATRATIVIVLWRLEGSPTGYTSNFSDVNVGSYYEPAIAWAQSTGIAAGTPGGTFKPDDAITKEQLIFFFYKYAQYKGYNTDITNFDTTLIPDYSSASSYLRDSIAWAAKYAIINTGTNFKPKDTAVRTVVATVSYNFVMNTEC